MILLFSYITHSVTNKKQKEVVIVIIAVTVILQVRIKNNKMSTYWGERTYEFVH